MVGPGGRGTQAAGYQAPGEASPLVVLKPAGFPLLICTCLTSRWSSPGIPAALPLV